MDRAGTNRLNRFGDMNLIDDFVELFPSYKHDDVFFLEFSFVIDRLERNIVRMNINEIINEAVQDEQRNK